MIIRGRYFGGVLESFYLIVIFLYLEKDFFVFKILNLKFLCNNNWDKRRL